MSLTYEPSSEPLHISDLRRVCRLRLHGDEAVAGGEGVGGEGAELVDGLQHGCAVLVLWKREFKLQWREAGPPNHHDDKTDSDQ